VIEAAVVAAVVAVAVEPTVLPSFDPSFACAFASGTILNSRIGLAVERGAVAAGMIVAVERQRRRPPR